MSSFASPTTVPAPSSLSTNPDEDPVLAWIRAGRLRGIAERPPARLALEWLWVRGKGCSFLWQKAVAASNLCRTVRAIVPVLALELFADGRVSTLSRTDIARCAGASLAQISAHLNALEACGFLYRTAGHRGAHTCYYPMMPIALARALSEEGRLADRARFAALLQAVELPPLAKLCAPVAGDERPRRVDVEGQLEVPEPTAPRRGGSRHPDAGPSARPHRVSDAERKQVGAFIERVAQRLSSDHSPAAAERLRRHFQAISQMERFCSHVLDILQAGYGAQLGTTLLGDNWLTAYSAGALVHAVAKEHARLVGAAPVEMPSPDLELSAAEREDDLERAHAVITPLLRGDLDAHLNGGMAPARRTFPTGEHARAQQADVAAYDKGSSGGEDADSAPDREGTEATEDAVYAWIPALLARLDAYNTAIALLPLDGVPWKVKLENQAKRAQLQKELQEEVDAASAASA